MPRLKMTVSSRDIPGKPVVRSPILPVFRGSGGGYDYECAGCEATLIENVGLDQFHAIPIECPQCGTVSAVARTQ
jgi:DNA-directed RNA polymerase subunit RPC12/RpoP